MDTVKIKAQVLSVREGKVSAKTGKPNYYLNLNEEGEAVTQYVRELPFPLRDRLEKAENGLMQPIGGENLEVEITFSVRHIFGKFSKELGLNVESINVL